MHTLVHLMLTTPYTKTMSGEYIMHTLPPLLHMPPYKGPRVGAYLMYESAVHFNMITLRSIRVSNDQSHSSCLYLLVEPKG